MPTASSIIVRALVKAAQLTDAQFAQMQADAAATAAQQTRPGQITQNLTRPNGRPSASAPPARSQFRAPSFEAQKAHAAQQGRRPMNVPAAMQPMPKTSSAIIGSAMLKAAAVGENMKGKVTPSKPNYIPWADRTPFGLDDGYKNKVLNNSEMLQRLNKGKRLWLDKVTSPRVSSKFPEAIGVTLERPQIGDRLQQLLGSAIDRKWPTKLIQPKDAAGNDTSGDSLLGRLAGFGR